MIILKRRMHHGIAVNAAVVTNPHQAFGAWFALVTVVVSLVLVCGTNRSSDRLDM
jgi:hypothetical protein